MSPRPRVDPRYVDAVFSILSDPVHVDGTLGTARERFDLIMDISGLGYVMTPGTVWCGEAQGDAPAEEDRAKAMAGPVPLAVLLETACADVGMDWTITLDMSRECRGTLIFCTSECLTGREQGDPATAKRVRDFRRRARKAMHRLEADGSR